MNYKDIRDKDPCDVSENLNKIGCFLIMIQQYEQAIEYLHNAISCRPLHHAAWVNCAFAQKEFGAPEELVDQYIGVASTLEHYFHDDIFNFNANFDNVPEPAIKAMKEFWEGSDVLTNGMETP